LNTKDNNEQVRNDYDRAWQLLILSRTNFGIEESKRGIINARDILQIKAMSNNNRLTMCEVLWIDGIKERITDKGKENLDSISKVFDAWMNDFEKEHGAHLLAYFATKFNYRNLNDNDFDELKKFIVSDDNRVFKNRTYSTKLERFERLKNSYISQQKKQKYEEVHVFSINDISVTYFSVPQIVAEAFSDFIKLTLRKTENVWREESGIPKIGEGWVSETEFYYKLSNSFQKFRIEHHASPKWLGRQHIDIYFPNENIGIEYQGMQHSRPVDFFGGEEQFLKQQKNDQRKAKKCKDNNCILIYVYPDYDFDTEQKRIQNLIKG
jgi:hypothetical protein